MDMCYLACVYRTPSGYCGSTGGAATCPHRQKKPTNADKLRAMSDKKLAEFYCNDVDACPPGTNMECIDELYAHGEGPYPSDKQCRQCWLDWLKREASE